MFGRSRNLLGDHRPVRLALLDRTRIEGLPDGPAVDRVEEDGDAVLGGQLQVPGDPVPVGRRPVRHIPVHERAESVEGGAVVGRSAVGLGAHQGDDRRVEPVLAPVPEVQLGLRRGQVEHQRPRRVTVHQQRLAVLVQEVPSVLAHRGDEAGLAGAHGRRSWRASATGRRRRWTARRGWSWPDPSVRGATAPSWPRCRRPAGPAPAPAPPGVAGSSRRGPPGSHRLQQLRSGQLPGRVVAATPKGRSEISAMSSRVCSPSA